MPGIAGGATGTGREITGKSGDGPAKSAVGSSILRICCSAQAEASAELDHGDPSGQVG